MQDHPLIREAERIMGDSAAIQFASGQPDLRAIDTHWLRRLSAEVLGEQMQSCLSYAPPAGLDSLLESLHDRFHPWMGPSLRCQIFSGSHQALDLLSRVLVTSGDAVLVQPPTYFGALETFRRRGAEILGIDADANLDASVVAACREGRVRVLYVSPDFANPTGQSLTMSQRRGLLRLADQYGLFIIEDSPYAQLSHSGVPAPSIAEISVREGIGTGRCASISSLSKIFAPGLRIGWALLPSPIADAITAEVLFSNVCASGWSQALAAALIQSGFLDAHMARVAVLYASRWRFASAALFGAAGGRPITHSAATGGYLLWCELSERVDQDALLEQCRRNGVTFFPGRYFQTSTTACTHFRLSVSGVNEGEIGEGIGRLRTALATCTGEKGWTE